MAKRIGIKVAANVLEILFRVGAVITGNNGLVVKLAENGVPDGHDLSSCGYDQQSGQFFFIFTAHGDHDPGPIIWQSPVYEKES